MITDAINPMKKLKYPWIELKDIFVKSNTQISAKKILTDKFNLPKISQQAATERVIPINAEWKFGFPNVLKTFEL